MEESAASHPAAHILGGDASAELGKAIFEITRGNPFYVEEMTKVLVKSGQVEDHKGQWKLRPGADLSISADLAGLMRERA